MKNVLIFILLSLFLISCKKPNNYYIEKIDSKNIYTKEINKKTKTNVSYPKKDYVKNMRKILTDYAIDQLVVKYYFDHIMYISKKLYTLYTDGIISVDTFITEHNSLLDIFYNYDKQIKDIKKKKKNSSNDDYSLREIDLNRIPKDPLIEEAPEVKTILVELGTVLNEYIKRLNKDRSQFIYFTINKTSIRREYYKPLRNVARFLRNNPNKKIVINGHTDRRGTDKINDPLSKYRAINVKLYLVKKLRVPAHRVIIKWFGSKRPVSPENFLNRRVEIKFTN